MFYKHHSPDDRLTAWRAIRQKDHQTVDEVLHEFANIKIIPRYIDYYTPAEWPNVFEIVKEGYFCQSGITLIIAATLVHKKFITTENIRFDVISNHTNGNEGIVLVHNDCVYNFLPGKAVSVSEALEGSTRFNSHTVPVTQLFS